ncbi:hypothetical protein KQX54_015642 [Cotesia glomerata]|uniref:Uncharacterized protein n=1 Tax=Cotesia glomerata TaxID=32391 RepID=A0AAV7J4I2_COTGL|nr:hypothetical protein KQX54_015642 [Cotesia glomerata]
MYAVTTTETGLESIETNSNKAAGTLNSPAALLHSTNYNPEYTPKRRNPGRPSKAELLTNKRGRDPDKHSPPAKLQRSSSSPPDMFNQNTADQVSSDPIPTFLEPDFHCSSFTDLLKQMNAWRIEDRNYLNNVKEKISEEIAGVQKSNSELIQAVREELLFENAKLAEEVKSIKTRLSSLEDQSSSNQRSSNQKNCLYSYLIRGKTPEKK